MKADTHAWTAHNGPDPEPDPMNRLQLQLVLHRLHSLVRAGPAALHNLRLAVELHVAGILCGECMARAWYMHGQAARGRLTCAWCNYGFPYTLYYTLRVT